MVALNIEVQHEHAMHAAHSQRFKAIHDTNPPIFIFSVNWTHQLISTNLKSDVLDINNYFSLLLHLCYPSILVS